MKFGLLQRKEQKTFKVRGFKGGTVTDLNAWDIPDNALSDSENMSCEKGVLCTRAGLSADLGNVIKTENPSIIDTLNFKVADSTVCINGKYKKIALEEYCKDDSIYYCNIFLVDADGKSTPAGNFVFNRITDEDFYQPKSILFYSGKAVNGAGVFAFVSSRNIYNTSQSSYRIYELSANLNSWQELNDYYVPVVYINGRGNNYEESKATGYAYTGTPMLLESQNMLTDRFKAYFTSDGYSSCFRLPFSDLNSAPIICRVYMNPTAYAEWRIAEGQSSASATFYTANITLNVDRKKGMLYFTDYEGDYPVPMMSKYHENNICITAGKTVENGFERVVSSTCCSEYGPNIAFSGGIDKGKVLTVNNEKPLYFPCDSVCSVGGNDGINALVSHKNGIFAFKQNEIYAITLKKGAAVNSSSLLADDDSVFYSSNTFLVKKVNGNKGLTNKCACQLYGNDVIWFGSDRAVYSINTSSFEITKLSEAVDGFLTSLENSEAEKAFLVQIGNRLLLLIGKKAVIIDFSDGGIKKPALYIWGFSDLNVVGGFSSSGKLCIFCTGTDGNVFYTAKLSGSEDTDICFNSGSAVVKSNPVPCMAQSKSFDFGNMSDKKIIESISLTAASKGKLEIYINGRRFDRLNLGKPDMDYTCGTLKTVKLIPYLSPVRAVQFKFCSDKAFSLGELIINYRETV